LTRKCQGLIDSTDARVAVVGKAMHAVLCMLMEAIYVAPFRIKKTACWRADTPQTSPNGALCASAIVTTPMTSCALWRVNSCSTGMSLCVMSPNRICRSQKGLGNLVIASYFGRGVNGLT
jgi:hypothetical protein